MDNGVTFAYEPEAERLEVTLVVSCHITISPRNHSDVVPATRLELSPRAGPTSGGTLVTITGHHLYKSDVGAQCVFGGALVEAVEAGDGFVRCVAPPHGSAASVELEVSLNRFDFTDQGARFAYEAPLHVLAVEPSWGPILGGTLVRVIGGRFREGADADGADGASLLRCRFGDDEVPARWHSPSELSCVAPPLGVVDEVQSLAVLAPSHVPEVQLVRTSAVPFVAEVGPLRVCAFLCSFVLPGGGHTN